MATVPDLAEDDEVLEPEEEELDVLERQRRLEVKSLLDALERALQAHGRPLHYTILTRMARDRLSTDVPVSDARVYQLLSRYKGRFVSHGEGVYGLREWNS